MSSNVHQKDYELSEVTLANGNGNSFSSNGSSNGHGHSTASASTGFTHSLLLLVLFALTIASLALGALTNSSLSALKGNVNTVVSEVAAETYHFDLTKQYYSSAVNRPPGFEGKSWQDTVQEANGQTVKFWMWSGNENINNWVDGWLAPQMLSHFGVTVERHPEGAVAAVAKVKEEVTANPNAAGSVDLIWINGNNFKNLKTDGNAYGPWANLVPNSKNFDFSSPSIKNDFGFATEGYEMPYNQAQCVFIYNTLRFGTPPMTIPDIVTWIKANPGKFTYSDPTSEFLGEAFVKHMFYAYASPYTDFNGPFDEALYNSRAPAVWAKLKEIEPYLYKDNSTGVIYPPAHTTIRDLFGSGDVWLDIAYDPTAAATNILNNKWPSTTKSYLLSTGTISNTNFLAIPKNSGKKAAAMVTANFVAQMESMFVRTQPSVWGALQAFNPAAKHIVDSGWDTPFNYIEKHASTPSVEDLAKYRLSELNTEYGARIKEDWKKYVKDA